MKRIFLVVLDSFGVGNAPDAKIYGDDGANTLLSVAKTGLLALPNLSRFGLFNIDGLPEYLFKNKTNAPIGSFAKMIETSEGKDTTTGHWEIAGIVTKKAFPTYPSGFPEDIIKTFEKETGRRVLCNKPYSGTEVIKHYGKEHIKNGSLIVYTSADSVFQIAAHENVVPLNDLYKYCKMARKILIGEHEVSRVIARPFTGNYPNFVRTQNRKDFSVKPPSKTLLDLLLENKHEVLAVGKISNIFAGMGISKAFKTKDNADGIDVLKTCMNKKFDGLCFVNLVDFDMLYGHRNNAKGYALALNFFDERLSEILENLKSEDILIITADHGCDPGDISTGHTRECTPLLVYGKSLKQNVNLGTRNTFADISATVLDYFNIKNTLNGTSFLKEVLPC